MSAGPPKYSRSSSFARDFFQSASDLNGGKRSFDEDDFGSGAAAVKEPLPPVAPKRNSFGRSDSGLRGSGNAGDRRANMMKRRESRRSIRGGLSDSMGSAAEAATASLKRAPATNGFGRGSDAGSAPPAAAAAASMPDRKDQDEMNGSMGAIGGAAERKPSWYAEALAQGGSGGDLEALLGLSANEMNFDQTQTGNNMGNASMASVHSNSNAGGSTNVDDEVLEQYRLMAHHEATMRVKENTGFDVAEYEKRRKNNPDPAKVSGDYTPRKIRPIMPEPRKVSMSNRNLPKPKMPTSLPLPRLGKKAFAHKGARVPDLLVGTVVRGFNTASPNEGEHIVRCLGCRSSLQVKLLATLVRCPECNTVSPASSTRR